MVSCSSEDITTKRYVLVMVCLEPIFGIRSGYSVLILVIFICGSLNICPRRMSLLHQQSTELAYSLNLGTKLVFSFLIYK